MSDLLVSCITPTFNRRIFFPRAIKCFLAQDYSPLEWVIVDNGLDSIKDLLPDDPRIKYFPLPETKLNHGQLMNRCCELAQGEIFIVLDDDDVYSPNRITRQITPFIENPAIQVTGTSTLYYYIIDTEKAFQYTAPTTTGWLGSIAVRRSAWLQHRFDNIPGGADYNFQRQTPKEAMIDLYDPTLVVASVHPNNACRKSLGQENIPVNWEIIKALVGEDL
jgi:glycosyltransferase involved in cell wall biosynthesis